MDETNIAQLVFALSVAREIASWEGPDFDLVVYHVQQAMQATKQEALRHGIVIDVEQDSELQ